MSFQLFILSLIFCKSLVYIPLLFFANSCHNVSIFSIHFIGELFNNSVKFSLAAYISKIITSS